MLVFVHIVGDSRHFTVDIYSQMLLINYVFCHLNAHLFNKEKETTNCPNI